MPHHPLIDTLAALIGPQHLLTDRVATKPYRTGYRYGEGEALAVAFPGTLVDLWRVSRACVEFGAAIIMQAANTGLTGGSTPFGDYDRPVVVVSGRRLDRILPIRGGRETICFAGATLSRLEQVLAAAGRAPHSVIGSSCIGASVVGGLCNNSGGALVARGPAVSRHALYAQVDDHRRLKLVNALGWQVSGDAEHLLGLLDEGRLDERDLVAIPPPDTATDYATHVRAIDEDTPARFNADPRNLVGVSGSAGKVIVFAARVPSFAAVATRTLVLGSDDPAALTAVRRRMLGSGTPLPVSAEYLHAGMRDLATDYGRDLCLAIRVLGANRIPQMTAAMRRFDTLATRFGMSRAPQSERVLQRLSGVLPDPLPARLRRFCDRFEHLLLLRIDEASAAHVDALLADAPDGLEVHRCTDAEGNAAFRLRFAAAGAAVRYAATHGSAGPLVAIDVALPRSDREWHRPLPPPLADQVMLDLRYGHFFCHVFHMDFVLTPGADPHRFETALIDWFEGLGAKCPAEHSFGHLYPAPPAVVAHYRALDPTNSLNPGIGQTSRCADWH